MTQSNRPCFVDVFYRTPIIHGPVLILTRDEVIDYLNEIIGVPITRMIRGLATEVILTPDMISCFTQRPNRRDLAAC